MLSRDASALGSIENITFPCAGEAMPGLILRPQQLPAPVVFVISTIFGLDDELQDVMRDYAQLGFITVAPDLFWRVEPGPISHLEKGGFKRASARYERLDVDQAIRDLESSIAAVRARPDYGGCYGILGYCFGGRYAFVAAARFGATLAVSFHGSNVENHLDEAGAVRCPISLHYGDADPVAPMAEIERIRAALQHNPDAEVCVYAGAGHGFTSPTKPSYQELAATSSRARAHELLQRYLKVSA